MSNYLDTSDFGMVAGSLLARKKRIKNRDRNEALILSAILAGINLNYTKIKIDEYEWKIK